MNKVFVSFGANIDNPILHIRSGLHDLQSSTLVNNFTCSSIIITPPMGPAQPDYLNGVCCFNFLKNPIQLLELLHLIESRQGRNRESEARWGPRTLDLDILLFGELQCNSGALTIPHPGLLQRGFVLLPLAEIAPNLIVHENKTALELANALKKQEDLVYERYDCNIK